MVKMENTVDKNEKCLKRESVVNGVVKVFFVIVSLLFIIPSIIFLISNKSITNFNVFYNFFLNDVVNPKVQTLCFAIIFVIIAFLYYVVIKKSNKIFKNIKETYIFIAIISSIFIFVLPFTSSDVYYYMGTGRLLSKYHQNPYYVSMTQFIEENEELTSEDEILQKCSNYWGDATVVYGPVWPIVCAGVTFLSCGNLNIALFIFKIFFVVLHMLSCFFIYKISNKKKFMIIYGLNPFILLEGIAHVHNDLVVITLVLGSLYFLLKKKNLLLSVLTLAVATAIKYFTILLLPFIIIYYFKEKDPLGRLKKCVKYGLIFLIPIILFYLVFSRDFEVLKGIVTQQDKLAKSMYLLIYLHAQNISVSIVNAIMLYIFTLFFSITCINMVAEEKKLKFIDIMKKYNIIIFFFLFGLITNFQPWYIMWLFPAIMWQKSIMIKQIISISLISQFANCLFMLYGEGYLVGGTFALAFAFLCMLAFVIKSIYRRRRRKKFIGIASEKT